MNRLFKAYMEIIEASDSLSNRVTEKEKAIASIIFKAIDSLVNFDKDSVESMYIAFATLQKAGSYDDEIYSDIIDSMIEDTDEYHDYEEGYIRFVEVTDRGTLIAGFSVMTIAERGKSAFDILMKCSDEMEFDFDGDEDGGILNVTIKRQII